MLSKIALKELNGLYTNNLVRHKYKDLKQFERLEIREKNKQFARILDDLNVPWFIQNQVAYASEFPENWIRYNMDVINDVINKYIKRYGKENLK